MSKWVTSDRLGRPRHVRFSPVSDRIAAPHEVTQRANFDQSASQQSSVSFDHVVDHGEQVRRDRKGKRLCGFEIDD